MIGAHGAARHGLPARAKHVGLTSTGPRRRPCGKETTKNLGLISGWFRAVYDSSLHVLSCYEVRDWLRLPPFSPSSLSCRPGEQERTRFSARVSADIILNPDTFGYLGTTASHAATEISVTNGVANFSVALGTTTPPPRRPHIGPRFSARASELSRSRRRHPSIIKMRQIRPTLCGFSGTIRDTESRGPECFPCFLRTEFRLVSHRFCSGSRRSSHPEDGRASRTPPVR